LIRAHPFIINSIFDLQGGAVGFPKHFNIASTTRTKAEISFFLRSFHVERIISAIDLNPLLAPPSCASSTNYVDSGIVIAIWLAHGADDLPIAGIAGILRTRE
jgi:hypothetical protein